MKSLKKEMTGYPSIDKPWLKYYDKEKFNYAFPKMNIYRYFCQQTKDCDDNIAMTYFGREITYAEMFKHIEDAAQMLTAVGVQSGNRILYLMPNIPETAYFFYGGAKIGAVSDYIDPRPVSINLGISAKQVLTLFQEEKIDFIISLDQCYLAMLKPIEEKLADLGVKEIIIVTASDSMNVTAKKQYLMETLNFNGLKSLGKEMSKRKNISKLIDKAIQNSPFRVWKYSDLISKCHDIPVTEAFYEADSLAVIVHTSGTSSSKAKSIPLTHDNLNCYVHQTFSANMPISKGDKALQVLPYFAAYGLVNVVHAGFCHVNNLILIPEFLPSNIGKLILKYKPQIFIGAPSWLLSFSADPIFNNKDLSYLKMITYGGDSMEISDEERINIFLKNHNCNTVITKGHGMSETSGCASYATGSYNVPGSVGIHMPYTTYAIVDPDTKEMIRFSDEQEYIEGEMIISSKMVTNGILDGKEIVLHRDYNGESYIFTRDIARMDKNGVITFLSRSDRSFTRFNGYKVKPHEIEEVIKQFDNVKYCVISPSYDDIKFGNIILADIVPKVEMRERREQVAFVERLLGEVFTNNENLSSLQIPVLFRFRSQLPLTSNSKVDYKALLNENLNGTEISVEIEETNISVGKITVH